MLGFVIGIVWRAPRALVSATKLASVHWSMVIDGDQRTQFLPFCF